MRLFAGSQSIYAVIAALCASSCLFLKNEGILLYSYLSNRLNELIINPYRYKKKDTQNICCVYSAADAHRASVVYYPSLSAS